MDVTTTWFRKHRGTTSPFTVSLVVRPSGEDFACEVRCESNDGVRSRDIFGVSSLQALVLGLAFLRAEVENSVRYGGAEYYWSHEAAVEGTAPLSVADMFGSVGGRL